jgi:hypothetical protein
MNLETLSLADIPALLNDLRRERFYGRLSFDSAQVRSR